MASTPDYSIGFTRPEVEETLAAQKGGVEAHARGVVGIRQQRDLDLIRDAEKSEPGECA